jgi:taurine transport system permease protein
VTAPQTATQAPLRPGDIAAGSGVEPARGRPPRRFVPKPETVRHGSISMAAVLAVFGLWWLVTSQGWVGPLFLPTPGSVWDAFVTASTEGYRGFLLWEHIAISLQRVAVAFFAALAIAIPLGMVVASSRVLETIVDPFVNFYRPLPPLAYYTLLVIWFGIGEMSKVLLLLLAAFPPLFIAVVSGVRGVRRERIDAARSLGASRVKTLRYVIFPSILPDVFTGIRVAVGFTYTTLVAAEMVAARTGIGWLVLDASRFLQTSYVFMGIIVMGVTGILLDAIVKAAQRRAVPWLGRA